MEHVVYEWLFFRGFFGVCYLQGLRFISTRDEKRHKAFHQVAEYLKKENTDGSLPVFNRSFFSDRYHVLDSELLCGHGIQVQSCDSAGTTTGFEILPSKYAEDCLNSLPESTKKLIHEAGRIFCEAMKAP